MFMKIQMNSFSVRSVSCVAEKNNMSDDTVTIEVDGKELKARKGQMLSTSPGSVSMKS